MKNKKLGLLLLPLLPLSAIGIVEVANQVVSLTQPKVTHVVDVKPIAPKRIEREVPPPAPAPVEAGPQPVITT